MGGAGVPERSTVALLSTAGEWLTDNLALVVVCTVGGGLLLAGDAFGLWPLRLVGGAVTLFGVGIATVYGAHLAQGREPRLGVVANEVFERFPSLLLAVVANSVVVGLVVGLPAYLTVVAVLPRTDGGLGIGLPLAVVFVAVAIYVGARLSLVVAAVVVGDRGPLAAVTASWRLSDRSVWVLAGLLGLNVGASVATNLVGYGGVLAVGLVSPLVGLALGGLFVSISDRDDSPDVSRVDGDDSPGVPRLDDELEDADQQPDTDPLQDVLDRLAEGHVVTTRELKRDFYPRHETRSRERWWSKTVAPALRSNPTVEAVDGEERGWRMSERGVEGHRSSDGSAEESGDEIEIPEAWSERKRDTFRAVLSGWEPETVRTREELQRRVYPDHALHYGDAETWWTEFVEPALREHPAIEPADSKGIWWRHIEREAETDSDETREYTWDEDIVAEVRAVVNSPAEKAAATAAVEAVPEEGVVTVRELQRTVSEEFPAGYDDAETWWAELVESVFQQHPAVEAADSKGVRWQRVDPETDPR